jgi:hypothetical protein
MPICQEMRALAALAVFAISPALAEAPRSWWKAEGDFLLMRPGHQLVWDRDKILNAWHEAWVYTDPPPAHRDARCWRAERRFAGPYMGVGPEGPPYRIIHPDSGEHFFVVNTPRKQWITESMAAPPPECSAALPLLRLCSRPLWYGGTPDCEKK